MKEHATEARFSFLGGINLGASRDSLDPHELLACTNMRVLPSGAVQRRAGVSKAHVTALGAAGRVRGFIAFNSANVAIANGKLYHSNDGDLSAYTEVTPASGSFSTAAQADFATFLNTGGSLLLFIASAGSVYTWDGSTLTKISGSLSVPAATCVRAFGSRVFYGAGDTLYWSKIGDGTDCTVGGLSDGGSATLDLGSDPNITQLEVIGSSLLIASSTGVARFSGTSDDIRLDQDTFGVSADIGPVSDSTLFCNSFQRVGDVVMMWTPRGPYAVTEGGITSIGEKLQSQGGASTAIQWRGTSIDRCYIAHNPARFEAWFIYKSVADTQARTAMVYNYAMQTWYGPMQLAVEVFSAGVGNDGGKEVAIVGCGDGFVRRLDDITANQDDGTDYTHTVAFAPTALKAGPHVTKSLRRVYLQVQRSSASTLPTVTVTPDGGTPVAASLVSAVGALNTPTDIRYDVDAQGKRFVVQVSDTHTSGTTTELPQFHGVLVEGSIMERI